MNHKIAAWCAVLVGLMSAAAFADTVRGPLKADVTLTPGTDATTIVLALEDLVSVRLADNGRFDNGVEVDVTIPPAARQYKNLLGLFVYKRVTPPPSQSVSAYSGARATFVVLPATAKAFIAIPVKDGVLVASPDTTTADAVIPAQDFPILLTILPVAKGLPASVTDSTFPIAISPIIADRGLLQLAVTDNGNPPSLPYSVSIDDQAVDALAGSYELASGIHHLHVSSDSYKDVYKTFGIDKGQTTRLDIALETLVPKLIFEAPENAQIFLDGKELDGIPREPMVVAEGDHTVIIRLGNYSLTKKFTVERGKTYKVSLFLDILVQEN